MEYVAKFEYIDGILCRFDTRIYLNSHIGDSDSVCVGAIIGKNPGSAKPITTGELSRLELSGDRMLPFVGNRFAEAFTIANKQPPKNAFIRVWNLFYVCNKNLYEAANISLQMTNQPICESELEITPFTWFGWGPSSSFLNPFKDRFLSRRLQRAFYYDHASATVIGQAPTECSAAKHTQGMPKVPIEQYLSTVV